MEHLVLVSTGHTNMYVTADATFETDVNGDGKITRLSNTLVPDLRTNLISVVKIIDKGFTITFNAEMAKIIDKNGHVAMIANRVDNLYFVQCRKPPIEKY